MSGIGQRLIEAREARGLSAADAAKKLHIRTMFVEALERDDWRSIGDPVYARGFLKNYARLLGLDGDALATEAAPEFGRDEATISAYAPQEARYARLESRNRTASWLVAVTGIVAAALVILVVVSGIGLLRGGSATQAVPAASPAPPTPQPAASPETLTQTAALPNAGQMTGVDLRISVTQPCWLSVTVDGKRVLYDTLQTGTVREFHADKQITLRAGNAGGIVATIDGKDIGSLGRVGQVEDRVFAIATPAPAPSSGAQ